jgi:hypothetical protein
MRVKWVDLEMAYQFVSGGGSPYNNRAFLCKRTGKLYYHSDLLGDDEEELPDDIEDEDKYFAIPHKKELDLGKPLVMDFVHEFLPGDLERVRDIFRKRGAYGRFKDFLVRRGTLDKWYKFEASMEEKALRTWCGVNSIELEE